jgi:GTPase involved in cell partitioning and DNA repair
MQVQVQDLGQKNNISILEGELKKYKEELFEKPHAIVLNKCDLEEAKPYIEEFQASRNVPTFIVSAKERIGLSCLLDHLFTVPLSLEETKG